MLTVNNTSNTIQWRYLLLALLLFSNLLPGLSACGKKGPLYHPPPEDQSEQQAEKK